MEHMDQDGNWIEEFKSQPYESEAEAYNKIRAVIDFHVGEAGWELNGTPHVEHTSEGYIAVIPLKKPTKTKRTRF